MMTDTPQVPQEAAAQEIPQEAGAQEVPRGSRRRPPAAGAGGGARSARTRLPDRWGNLGPV